VLGAGEEQHTQAVGDKRRKKQERERMSNQRHRAQGLLPYRHLGVHRRRASSTLERRFEVHPWLSSEAAGSSAPLPYRWQNVFVSQATLRLSMYETARASFWARMVQAFPVSCFLCKRARYVCAAGWSRRNNTAASEKAHFRWALPLLAPEVPRRLPADSLLPLTRRH
jgi:hypothetical protein